MAKLVEGQLDFLNLVSAMSFGSSSFTSSTMRRFVQDLNTSQANYPDTIPREISVQPIIEADTGRVVSSIA